jgi:hypothetical protein
MVYTDVMSRNNRNARGRSNGPGRKVHFDEGRNSGPSAAGNGPNSDTYVDGAGNVRAVSEKDRKERNRKDIPGVEWHPAVKTATSPIHRTGPHHTTDDYVNGCPRCEALEEQRVHPNGSRPWDD